MTAAYFLMLREGLEAALIVGIIAAYLVKLGRRDAMGKVWLGVGAAAALSMLTGAAVVLTVRHLPIEIQEVLEGIASLLAVIVLTWMLFWMRRQGRAIKGDLERGVDVALAAGSTLALAGLAFIAVTREGLEIVLFVIAIGASNSDAVTLAIASMSGLFTAIGIGYAIFALGVRIDLRRFFDITGVILIFVSAGLVAFSLGEFMEAGVLSVTPIVVDLRQVLPETSLLGSLLNGLFGYRAVLTTLEVAGYLLYLIPVLAVFLLSREPKAAAVSAG